MNSPITAYVALASISGVLNLYLFVYVYLNRHHYKKIGTIFLQYTAAITIYCFASAFSLLSSNTEQLKFWTMILYIGLPFASPLGLLFIMHYLGLKVTMKRFYGIVALPIITVFMVATNDWHQLYYRVYEIDPILGAPYFLQEIGIWYVIQGIFTFGCMFAAIILLLSRWKETEKLYRPQFIALMFGQMIPMLTAVLYLFGGTPEGIDPVPMVLWISSLLYVWAIRSTQLFVLMPVAKEAIFNSINDGVMVLDESFRLIEFNLACKRNFPLIRQKLYGTKFSELWMILTGSRFPITLQMDMQSRQEIEVSMSNLKSIFQVRITPLQSEKSKGLLLIFTDITEVKRLHTTLERHASYDDLTQIYNRRAFLEQSEKDFLRTKKERNHYSIVLVDIDFFKRVNDEYGHHIGDQVLKHMVNICENIVEDRQLFARYGGEEFVFSVESLNIDEVRLLAERIRQSVEKQPFTIDSTEIFVTVSLGIAEAKSDDEETLSDVLNKADKALYSAKTQGRNKVCVFVE